MHVQAFAIRRRPTEVTEDGASSDAGGESAAQGESCVCTEELMSLVERCAARYTHLTAKADTLLFFKLVQVCFSLLCVCVYVCVGVCVCVCACV